ncbi:acetyl/propionyl/methylcrotonyl-CoA carboxylase subunit alpha [Chloroflexota bacterium]
MNHISRVLVANRGEIAVRIIRACKDLGIEAVAAVSEADRESLAAKIADRAVCIGPARALDSYLRIDTLVTAALGTGSDAIHPGYGFLAEQPELAEACEENGVIFIGPPPGSLREMGNKLMARQIAGGCGVSTIPGSEKVKDFQEAAAVAEKMGFPVLLKAAAGGGGRGITIAANPNDLETVFDMVSAEVHAAFGDGTLFVEHYIPNARHVEVQIVADRLGNVRHLGERDCSIQRRYQKVIEEAPSPVVPAELREQLCAAAVTVAETIGYESAGTVEFILDQDSGQFFFLEMNTRIQVEHPVTEQISGVDLVKEQIRIAGGEPVSFSQEEVTLNGHAVECRINAECAEAGFRPSPGRIERWQPPQGANIRVDSHCYSGYIIPPYYDSLIAKLITWGNDRAEALEWMQYALDNFIVRGVETTIPFLSSVIRNPDYVSGKINTRWLENLLARQGVGTR